MKAGHYISNAIGAPFAFLVRPETVGQFTGLKDKNNNPIYENDILETGKGIAQVVWEDAAFALKSPGSDAIDWVPSSVFEQSIIVGNIFENPELLK